MKKSTIAKYTKIIEEAKAANKSIRKYCEENGFNYSNVYSFIRKKNKSQIEIIRDSDNKIIQYHVTVYRQDKTPFTVVLERQDTEILVEEVISIAQKMNMAVATVYRIREEIVENVANFMNIIK